MKRIKAVGMSAVYRQGNSTVTALTEQFKAIGIKEGDKVKKYVLDGKIIIEGCE